MDCSPEQSPSLIEDFGIQLRITSFTLAYVIILGNFYACVDNPLNILASLDRNSVYFYLNSSPMTFFLCCH